MNAKTEKGRGIIAALIGCAVMMVVCIVGAMVGPIFILNEYLEGDSVYIIATAVRALGAMLGVMTAGFLAAESKLTASLSALLGGVLLMCFGAAIFEGDLNSYIVGMLSVLVGIIVSLILLNGKKKAQNRGRVKRHSR